MVLSLKLSLAYISCYEFQRMLSVGGMLHGVSFYVINLNVFMMTRTLFLPPPDLGRDHLQGSTLAPQKAPNKEGAVQMPRRLGLKAVCIPLP